MTAAVESQLGLFHPPPSSTPGPNEARVGGLAIVRLATVLEQDRAARAKEEASHPLSWDEVPEGPWKEAAMRLASAERNVMHVGKKKL